MGEIEMAAPPPPHHSNPLPVSFSSLAPSQLSKTCHAYLHSGKYEALKNKVTPNNFVRRTPDLLVFFNAGFTCLDYDWSGCLSTCFSPRSPTVPFLATTNSEMENFNDIEWLEENGFVKEGSIAGLGADVDDTDVDEGERVRDRSKLIDFCLLLT